MVDAKEIYKKAMDDFADSTCTVTAESILEASNANPSKVTPIRKHMGRRVACILAATLSLSTAVFAQNGYNPVAVIYENTIGKPKANIEISKEVLVALSDNVDDITQDLIDQGFVAETEGTVVSKDGKFKTHFIGVAGDMDYPYMIAELYVKDKKIYKNYDKILTKCYALNKYLYDNKLEDYVFDDVYATRDEKNEKMYHLQIPLRTAGVDSTTMIVVDVSEIWLELGQDEWDIYADEHMAQDFYTEDFVLKETVSLYDTEGTEGHVFTAKDVEFRLTSGELNSYTTQFGFRFDYVGSAFDEGERTYSEIGPKVFKKWNEICKNMKLIVDGKKYSVKEAGYPWCDEENARKTYVAVSFPAVFFINATKIELQYDGQIMDLTEDVKQNMPVSLQVEAQLNQN